MSLHEPNEVRDGITVSIVTYNTWPTTWACIRSLLTDPPRGRPLEILVVDNGVPDTGRPPDMVDDVSVYESPVNLGYGRGHNYNLNRAKLGRFLILNPDTLTTGDALESLASALDADQEIVLVAPRLVYPDGRSQTMLRTLPGIRTEIGRVFGLDERLGSPWSTLRDYAEDGEFQQVGQAGGPAMMFRTSELRELQGFDERFPMYFEDVDLCRRAERLGVGVCHLGTSIVHEGGGTAKRYRTRAIYWVETSRMRYFSSYETGFRRLVLSILTFASCITHFGACVALMVFSHESDRAELGERARGYLLAALARVPRIRRRLDRTMLSKS